jgi:ABC-2 type transport system ATP-binding protein
MQQKFFDVLKEENRKGTTILFSSHILSEVQRLCDRVAIIKEGRLIALEKISTLQENNYKKIKLETKESINDKFFNLPGVSKIEIRDQIVSFLFRGNINVIMKKLAELQLTNLLIEEPDLEEIFMHYYEKES